MTFDYFYGRESDLFSFIRIPKILFTDSQFARLSAEAKIMYGLLLDRMCLSSENGWKDELDRVFVIYSIEEVEETLHCGNKKAGNVLRELEDFGLIEKKRQGLSKPNLIFVKNFAAEVFKEHFKKCQNDISGDVEMTLQEVSKGHGNNTENNKTELNDTNSIPFVSETNRSEGKRTAVEKRIAQELYVDTEYEAVSGRSSLQCSLYHGGIL